MARTKKETEVLRRILVDLEDLRAYIKDDRTAIMRETSLTSTDIFRAAYYPGKAFINIGKDIGSPLCRLQTAITKLEGVILMPAGVK